MPRSSSTARLEVRRRDRHKVYAATDLQKEGRSESDTSPPPAALKECSEGNCSTRVTALSRAEREHCDSKAVSNGGLVGRRVDIRNSYHEAPVGAAAAAAAVEKFGIVGPGAEPPVAVASHAFAHEEPHKETVPSNRCWKSREHEKEGAGPSFPGDEGMDVPSNKDDVRIPGSVDRGGTSEPSRRCHHGKEDTAGSRPESSNTNNEEEAETLQDSFNLSDEYGLEGASTGRNHQEDDDDCDEEKVEKPVFFGLDVESTSSGNREKRGQGQGRPAGGRYLRTRRNDDESSSEYEPRQHDDGSRGVYASASDSDCWPSSSRERQTNKGRTSSQQQPWFGRRARQNSRRPLLTAMKRNSRIVPLEDVGERRAGESEGTRRHRRSSSRNSAQHRSPTPRQHARGPGDDNHRRRSRRGVSGHRNRGSRRRAQTETESMSGGPNYRFEAEMARLRRENEALKQQRERSTR